MQSPTSPYFQKVSSFPDIWGISSQTGFSYACEHLDEDGSNDIFVGKTMPNIIHCKIQSRHVSSKSYYLWIQFDTEDEDDPIKFWY